MIFEKLRELLCEQLELDEDEVTMDTNIVKDLGADSLDVVELLMALEDEYDITITDDAVRELYTVREVVEFVDKMLDEN